MQSGHFLNFSRIQPELKVYRYVSFERLLELVIEGVNKLVLPSKWDDPFENYYLRSTILFPDGAKAKLAWADSQVFAQCWTTERRSDAMWRLYCRQAGTSLGVRVRTSLRRLEESLMAGLPPEEGAAAYIGRVRYLSDAAIKREAASFYGGAMNPRKVAQALLVKRNAFRHEAEVRVVVRSPFRASGALLPYDFDANEVIDQIMFDPWATDSQINEATEQLRSLGVKARLMRSLLYRTPRALTLPF